jgi:putative serine protease PepD
MAAGEVCDRPFSEVFEEASPSVVRVFAVTIDPFSLVERVRVGVGSGVVFDDRGRVVTNAHVIHEATEIMMSLDEDDMRPARVVGFDLVSDLAVIEFVDPAPPLTKADLGSSADLPVGTEVLAIGFPYGIGKTASRGIVSAVERVLHLSPMSWLTPMIQTDAAISPGNSGGPLIDRCGKVVAINTLVTERGQNLNFAIPIDTVREVVKELIDHGRVVRAWHGIHGRIVPPPLVLSFGIPPGFLVETIEPGSPSAKIGMRGGNFPVVIGVQQYLLGGDVILRVNGEVLRDMSTVTRIARSLEVGDKIHLEYWRNGQILSTDVVLPERPALPGDARRFGEKSGR